MHNTAYRNCRVAMPAQQQARNVTGRRHADQKVQQESEAGGSIAKHKDLALADDGIEAGLARRGERSERVCSTWEDARGRDIKTRIAPSRPNDGSFSLSNLLFRAQRSPIICAQPSRTRASRPSDWFSRLAHPSWSTCSIDSPALIHACSYSCSVV